jgi:hypothetical protein
MERRNWSLEALNRLLYIDSMDDEARASLLASWCAEYLDDDFLDKIDLSQNDLNTFNELFYKNINFLKQQKKELHKEIKITRELRKFFQ